MGRLEGRCWRRRKGRWNRAREGHHLELKGLRDGEEGRGLRKRMMRRKVSGYSATSESHSVLWIGRRAWKG